jgi:hypothetical protein
LFPAGLLSVTALQGRLDARTTGQLRGHSRHSLCRFHDPPYRFRYSSVVLCVRYFLDVSIRQPAPLVRPARRLLPVSARKVARRAGATPKNQGNIPTFHVRVVRITTIHYYLATPTLRGRLSFFNAFLGSPVDFLWKMWISSGFPSGVYFVAREAHLKRDCLRATWRFSHPVSFPPPLPQPAVGSHLVHSSRIRRNLTFSRTFSIQVPSASPGEGISNDRYGDGCRRPSYR